MCYVLVHVNVIRKESCQFESRYYYPVGIVLHVDSGWIVLFVGKKLLNSDLST